MFYLLPGNMPQGLTALHTEQNPFELRFEAGDVRQLGLYAGSTEPTVVGQPMTVYVRTEDQWGNRTTVPNQYAGRVHTVYSSQQNLEDALRRADLVVGAVLVPGARAPKLVRREHLSLMKDGAALVDVAVDQGGCAETTHATTHADPTYIIDGVVHYAVANMPGAVARTSTFALNNVTLPYGLKLANQGWRAAVEGDPSLRLGLNVLHGAVTYEAVATAHDLPFQASI